MAEETTIGTPVFQMSIETQELLKAAKKLRPGETMPNDEVAAITGRTIEECRGLTDTVARHIMRDSNRVVAFHPHRYGGLHCLTDAERIEQSSTNMRGVGRKLRRISSVVTGASDAKLNEEERAHKACIGTLCKLLSAVHGKAKAIGKAVQVADSEQLKIGETLTKLFGGK